MEKTAGPLGGWQTVPCQSNTRYQPLRDRSIKGILILHIYFLYSFTSVIYQAQSDKTSCLMHRSWNARIGKVTTQPALTECKGLMTPDCVAEEQRKGIQMGCGLGNQMTSKLIVTICTGLEAQTLRAQLLTRVSAHAFASYLMIHMLSALVNIIRERRRQCVTSAF